MIVKVQLDKERIAEAIEKAERPDDALIDLFKMLFEQPSDLPEWDDIERLDGHPECNTATSMAIYDMFLEDPQFKKREQTHRVMAWGPWFNSGWSSVSEHARGLDDWQVSIDTDMLILKDAGEES